MAVLVLALGAAQAKAANYDVTDSASFVSAVATAGNGDTITILNSFTMTTRVDPISANVTVIGNGNTIDAANAFRPFFVYSGTVAIQDLTVANGMAQGGRGGDANVGGGGGLGAGGAIFVNTGASVTITNVSFQNNQAVGGRGGQNTGLSLNGGGGGGGLGGNGGDGALNASSAGGGGGLFGAGGNATVGAQGGGGGGGGFFAGANGGFLEGGGGSSAQGPGNGAAPGPGGTGVGAGFDGTSFGDGGGGGVSSGGPGGNGGPGGGGGGTGDFVANNPATGGNGGIFGGGGGTATGYTQPGNGGFGGGGGGGGGNVSGIGGFGGGGGGAASAGTPGGFGGGAGGIVTGGGGGAMGGAIFVAAGGSLSISGASTEGGSGVTAGSGFFSEPLLIAGDGSAYGSGIFFQGAPGGAASTLTFGAGNQTYAGTIADLNGAAGNTTTANGLGGTGGIMGLAKTGGGILTLSGANSYSGGTSVAAGTLSINNGDAIGTGDLAMAEGTSLRLDGSFTLNNNINIAGDPIFDVTAGNTVDVVGVISDAPFPAPPGVVEKIGAGTLVLSGLNTYSGGTVISAGILQVTNSSSVGSGAVTLDGGTFQADGVGDLTFTNGFKINTPGGTVDNNGIELTLSGLISNGNGATGVLQLTDSSGGLGLTVLSGANTHSGGTTVVGTTVQVTNSTLGVGSSVGTGTVTLENAQFQAGAADLVFGNNFRINDTPAGSAIDANGYALTIAGVVGGPGALTVLDTLGGGVLILTNANTYSGGTTICGCATLQLGTLATAGSIVGAVTNEGAFDIVNANTAGITSITNDGAFGFATTTFFNATSASSIAITNDNGGATIFGVAAGTDTATAGNAVITNSNGGSTAFLAMTTAGNATITNQFGSGTFFGDSSTAGNASITNQFGGQTIFGTAFGADAPSAGAATISNELGGNTEFNAFATASSARITNGFGGSTDFFDSSTAGNAVITTSDGGATFFWDNADGGAAQFITADTGFVDFSGSLGPNGDGRIAAGSIAGSGFYYIGGGNTLVVGGNHLSTEVSGEIADFDPCGCGVPGPGSLEKVGTGTLALSGANSYTGTTVVNGGTLDVTGSIASSILTTVNANAALTGAGTVGDAIIANGGIFLPGNGTPGSSMTVAGNLALQSGALYLVQLNSVTSTYADVTGAAALAGNVGASFAPGSSVLSRYTILTAAGGHSGAFGAAAVIGGPGGLVATLSYDPTHAYLDFALDFGATPGLNVNQRNVGNALTNFFNANGGIPAAFATLTPPGLTQVSGELATGTQQGTFDAMNLFLGLLTDPFIDGRRGPSLGGATPFASEDSASAYAARRQTTARDAFAKFPAKAEVARNHLFDPRWSVWGAAFGGGSTTDGNAALGSNTATARAFGFAAGADYRISPATLAGFALAGGGTHFAVNGFGSGRSDLFQAGAFVRHAAGRAYVTGALAYAWQDVTTDRTVTVAGVDRLRAQFNANAWSGRIEGGYRFVTPWMGVTPYAAGQFTTYQLPAYAEQVLSGANTFALNYAARDVTASRTELGIRTDKSFAVENGILTLRGRAAWAHNFNTDRSITPVFQTLPARRRRAMPC